MTSIFGKADAEEEIRPEARGDSRARGAGAWMRGLLLVVLAGCFFAGGRSFCHLMPGAYAATLCGTSSEVTKQEQSFRQNPAMVAAPVPTPSPEAPSYVIVPVATPVPQPQPQPPPVTASPVSYVPGYIPDPLPPATDNKYQVQAILVAKTNAILSSAIDGRIVDFPYKSGDVFKKGEVLARFDCGVDRAKLKEIEARARLSDLQLRAYSQLRKMDTVSEIELQTAFENNAQNLAQIEQINQRLRLCNVVAPFDGIVTHRMVNQHEFVQTGRVLMDVASREPLQAEFLAPSVWLRWLNIGTPLSVYIDESGRKYDARLIRISGEVDPVSQSVQVVAEMGSYHEELLPGMSGRATFSTDGMEAGAKFGYHGLILEPRFPSPKKKR